MLGVMHATKSLHASVLAGIFEGGCKPCAPAESDPRPFLCSLAGEQFVQFVMSPSATGDDVYLYEQLVEPVLQSGARFLLLLQLHRRATLHCNNES